MPLASEPIGPAPRAGRPRDPRIDTAVFDATLTLLEDAGYAPLTISAVARRAGATKPAIYRRWQTRRQLVLAALAQRLGEVPVPDTGCTLCDLSEGIKVFLEALDRMPPDVLGPLLADCAHDADLRAAFMTSLFDPPRAAVAQMLDHARARGDLRSDIDRDLILDLLGSLVHYRALFGHAPTSESDIERAVSVLLRGIAVDYPRLIEHSRNLAGDAQIHPLHA